MLECFPELTDLCVAFLMLNLLDAFRIEMLLALQTNRGKSGEQDTAYLPRAPVYEHELKRFSRLSRSIEGKDRAVCKETRSEVLQQGTVRHLRQGIAEAK
jgi:hypothetical protein